MVFQKVLAGFVACAGLVVFATPRGAAQSTKQLTLPECLQIAEQRHPDPIASRALVDAAAARLKVARSGFLPRLDVGASYTRQTYNFAAQPGTTPHQVTLFSNGESFSNAPYYYGGLTFSQTLHDFGRTRGAVNRSQAELEASRHDLARTRDLVDLNVRLAYDEVLAAEQLVRVRQDAVQNQSKHLDQIKAFYQVGTRPKIDVTRQSVTLANAQVGLRQAQEDLQVARAALATAMGEPIEQTPEPVNAPQQEAEPPP